jgi:tRNA(His) 5'-end guanylyltransferase
MNRDEFNDLGKKHKQVEEKFRHYLLNDMYTVVRLDGRAFHTFTRGLEKPFSENFMHVMTATTSDLIKEFHATLGYTQSDEITLIFPAGRDLLFNGIHGKILSTMASYASVSFRIHSEKHLPEKNNIIATFDARVMQYSGIDKVIENLMWRETDATRNSLSMLCQSLFSQKALHGKGTKAQHDMLHSVGVNWNDLDIWKKRGTYMHRRVFQQTLSPEELAKIPKKHQPANGEVTRSSVVSVTFPPLESIISDKCTDSRYYYQLCSIIDGIVD